MEDTRNAYKVLVGKPYGKRLFGRRYRLEGNIRMDFEKRAIPYQINTAVSLHDHFGLQ
jgi:hypothetical protein